ncbi:DEAD/DEAH box helicase [Leptolyngbya sp. AN10]|uniref:DEAD/DEAH box helicase n=1 Tax=Leptolyngbya sp. AN10 TaxID=3423365 RepID=UPI003D3135AB
MNPTSKTPPDYGMLLQQFYGIKETAAQPDLNQEDETPETVQDLIASVVTHQETVAAQNPKLIELPEDLPPSLTKALNYRGIHALYSHQNFAYAAINEGKDVVITTATASGKTLGTFLAILKGIIEQNHCCLAFYNLKALASDQATNITELLSTIPEQIRPRFHKLTGDTPTQMRKEILASEPHILGVTPEFLHYQLRTTWKSAHWQTFLSRLKYIVLDEAHTLRGVFGGNVHMLIQRIKLAVDHYAPARSDGSLPSDHLQFVVLSATCGNAVEHCRHLTGRPKQKGKPSRLVWIEKSGAISAGKDLFVLRPSASSHSETAKLVYHLMQQGKTGIVFTNSISSVKTIYNLINKESQRRGLNNIGSQVVTYYSALRAQQREDILEQVRDGRTRWLISTEALESGIDIASLDCSIVRGWPGSVQSFRQAIGRCGRQNPGFAFYLPTTKVMDLYYATHPALLLHGAAEVITFQVPVLLLAKHILCAAVETGIPVSKLKHYFGSDAFKVVQELLRQGQISRNRSSILWTKGFPHRDLNFRGGFNQSLVSLLDQDGEEIEQMSQEIAQREVFQNAIYRCQNGEGKMLTYHVLDLDLETKSARLKQITDTDTFTQATTHSELNIHTRVAGPSSIDIEVATDEAIAARGPDAPCLNLEMAWADIRYVVDGYDVFARRYERACVNQGCLKFHAAISVTRCSNCGKPTRYTEITQMVDTIVFDQPSKIEMTTPVVEVYFNKVARKWLEHITRSLKSQIKQETKEIPKEYRSLWEFSGEYLALHTIGHQLLKAFPIVVRSDTRDANFQIYNNEKGITGVFYNVTPESGVVENLFTRLPEVARKAGEIAQTCSCKTGCGNCLIQHGCPDGNTGLLKSIGLQLLDAISQPQK